MVSVARPLEYSKQGSPSCVNVDKVTGKVTVKKGTKAGTYSCKASVTAAGDATYKSATKTVAVKVTVK